MATLTEIRQQYPQYDDMPDDAFADAIYKKFYSDMPRTEFDSKVGAPPKMSVAEDVARSAATGAGEGVTQSVGILGDVQGLADQAGEWIGTNIFGLDPLTPEQSDILKKGPQSVRGIVPDISAPTTADIEAATGFDQMKHTPQTTAGEFARTGMSFAAPAFVAGIGKNAVKTAVKYGAVPGVVSEGAGQLTEDTGFEEAARILGGLGGAGVMAVLTRPTTAAATIKRALPEGVTNNDIMRADMLVAQSRSSGVPITWPEALHKATDGRVDITGLQRIVEQTRGGQPIMSDFMGQRPGQTKQAMGGAMDDLTYGATMQDPRLAGQNIQRAADQSLTDIRKRINQIAEPYYSASAGTRISPAEFQRLSGDELYQQALKAVRNDPIHSRFVANLPDDSVGVQNEIKKYFDRMADKSAPLGDKTAASVYGGVGRDVRDTAKRASPDYEQALGLEEDLRRRVLNPVEIGPIGAASRTDDILAQGKALLSAAPAEGSERAVRETVRLLSGRVPDEAFQLVRTHLRGQFDEITQNLIAGPNEWGGAKFAAAIRGNSQQAKNLEAAIKALPDGEVRWEGLNAFLDVLEATGRRQRPGSMTAFNKEAMDDLKGGGIPVETARALRTVGQSWMDFYQQWKLGKNSEALANIFTDPRSGQMLADLARARSPAGKQTLAGYLVTYYSTQPLVRERGGVPAEQPAP